jgi:hypothetical protein
VSFSFSETNVKQRVFKIVSSMDLDDAIKQLQSLISVHVFSVAVQPKSASDETAKISSKTSADAIWIADHLLNDELFSADPALSNSLRDNR